LLNADKPDSQDICFVPNGDYAEVVRQVRPEAQKKGDIVHIDGRVVGEHDGIVNYTIGQRKGIGIGGGISNNNEPLYVIGLQPDDNQVIVGPKQALARDIVTLNDCNWLDDYEGDIQVKLRSVSQPYSAKLSKNDNGTVDITLDMPQYGISPGQAAVCYAGERVIGGGWIIKTNLQEMQKVA
jgi:tRNA-specific 2-thiouridylase